MCVSAYTVRGVCTEIRCRELMKECQEMARGGEEKEVHVYRKIREVKFDDGEVCLLVFER